MKSQSIDHVVKLVKNKEGDSITAYGNTGYGFIEIGCNRFLAGQNEFVLHRMKGELNVLRLIISDHFVDEMMSGRVIVKEFLESQVPNSIMQEYYHKKKPYAEAVLEFLKKDSRTGLPVTINGERVVRITEFIKKPDSSDFISLITEYHSPK